MKVILLMGASGSGKSTLARAISDILGVDDPLGQQVAIVSTSDVLRSRNPGVVDPDELRKLGNDLDREDPGWFMKAALSATSSGDPAVLVVDAIRTPAQMSYVRHFTLGYRKSDVVTVRVGDLDPRDGDLWNDRPGLGIDLTRFDPRQQAVFVLERTLLVSGTDGVIGAQWGSEGKGKIAAWLSSGCAYAAMARAGGPNAGHRIELPGSGKFRVLRHLPSGTPYAKSGTKLCIGPGAVLDLGVLMGEMDIVPPGCEVIVDPRAVIVTDASKKMEQDYALSNIGSTMTGTGGAMAERVLRTGVTAADELPRTTLERLGIRVSPVGQVLREAALRGRLLLESTQGMQLSLFHGEYPHVTSRDVSPAMLLAEVGLPAETYVIWYVVARTYPIRVGGPSGNLPNETDWDVVGESAGRTGDDLRAVERTSVTNRLRRTAHWTPGMLSSAVMRSFSDLSRVRVAITFADYLKDEPLQLDKIIREARACSSRSVVVGTGPKTEDVHLYV